MWLCFPRRLALLALATGLAFSPGLASPAFAELGGSVSGVRADSVPMRARMVSVNAGRFTRHDLTRTNGGMVREWTNPAGQVFAVTWSGPGKPDLRALLGRYFATMQGVATAQGGRMRGLRRPPQLSQSDLQVQTSGHMGWFSGVAFIPSLAPQGFSTSELPVQP